MCLRRLSSRFVFALAAIWYMAAPVAWLFLLWLPPSARPRSRQFLAGHVELNLLGLSALSWLFRSHPASLPRRRSPRALHFSYTPRKSLVIAPVSISLASALLYFSCVHLHLYCATAQSRCSVPSLPLRLDVFRPSASFLNPLCVSLTGWLLLLCLFSFVVIGLPPSRRLRLLFPPSELLASSAEASIPPLPWLRHICFPLLTANRS